jgi:hypothetical protein
MKRLISISLNQNWNVSKNFSKGFKYKILRKFFHDIRAAPRGQTDRRADC